jgi:hypothetical protein
MMRRLFLLLAVAFVEAVLGTRYSVRAAAEGDPPAFVLQTTDGRRVTGPLVEIGPDWSVRLAGDERAAGADLLGLRHAGKVRPAPGAPQDLLLFANGDRISGRLIKLDDERLHFQPDLGDPAEAVVPLTALVAILPATPAAGAELEPGLRRLAGEKRTRDAVRLRNGDAVEGTLVGLDENAVRVEVKGQTAEVKRGEVAAIALNTELVRTLRPKGPYGRLLLANGCRVSLREARSADGKVLTGATLFDAPLRVPVEDVVALAVRQGKAVYLSELKPARHESVDYLGSVRWPVAPDGSVKSRDLWLGGAPYDGGLGVAGGSRVTYALPADCQRFEALVGLDDRDGRQGAVRVQVLLDGKPQKLDWDGRLTWRDGPRPVGIALGGAKELTLVVEHDRHGGVQDCVNWADARLVR